MAPAEDTPWSTAVRVLALLSAVLLIVVVMEARTVRQARAELQQLRTEREQAKASVAASWARESVDEVGSAIRWLDTFYSEPSEGFGKRGGLCADGRLDDGAIASYLAAGFLQARGSGSSYDASIAAMRGLIVKSNAYRAVHADLAAPPDK